MSLLERLLKLPLLIFLMGAGAASMFVPAIVAAGYRDWEVARSFFYSGSIFLVLTTLVALALANRAGPRSARAPLFDVVMGYALLPAMLAVPLYEVLPFLSFSDAYFEMVSSLTTTGATLLHAQVIPDTVHLWRALVGWLGGFLIWVITIAVLAPLSLGGFEVLGRAPEPYSTTARQIGRAADTSTRLIHYMRVLLPIYVGLTVVLWFGLFMLGDSGLVALCHAMSTLATSGISPIDGPLQSGSGFGGELFLACFLLLALSRQTFTQDGVIRGRERLLKDQELRVGLTIAVVLPVLLFLRHWVGAITEDGSALQGLAALWGGFFTVLSFLTTTGFESASWDVAKAWSGINTPGLIFMGLAMIGGGVATTAGGIKLLRVHVLYRYSQAEVDRLIYPSSIGRKPQEAQKNWRQGAFIAWVFFMLYLITIAMVMLLLAATGVDFESALLLSVAALTTTGPLVAVVGETQALYSTLSLSAQLVLAFSMVLGRLETLAIISLLNPEFWRK